MATKEEKRQIEKWTGGKIKIVKPKPERPKPK